MELVFVYALVSVIIVSLISLIGIFVLSWNERFLSKCIFVLVSLAVGALFGDAIIHLIPSALKNTDSSALVSFFVLLGVIVFFVLEKFLHWHHHPDHTHSHREEELVEHDGGTKIKPLGFLVLTSDSVHNFIDGLIIGASYFISIEVGIATTIAVILHEIPQEISDFGLLIHAGFSKGRALFLNFTTALFALVGLFLAFAVQGTSEQLVPLISAFAAGNFLYIAGSDLVPELHKTSNLKKSFIQFTAILVGIALMFALLLFE